MRSLRGRLATAAGFALLVVGIVPGPIASAHTDATVIAEPCVNLRSQPSLSGAVADCIPRGSRVSIECTTRGDSVPGPFGATDLWDRVTWAGATGFVADAMIESGTLDAAAGDCNVPTDLSKDRPTGEIVVFPPSHPAPLPRQSARAKPSALIENYRNLIAMCGAVGFSNCDAMGKHYLEASGEDYQYPIGDLIASEKPLQATYQRRVREHVATAMKAARRTPPSTSRRVPFDTGWFPYSATGQTDWYYSLAHFQIRVVGDLWIGAEEQGDRPIQGRYRLFLFDLFDYGPTGNFAQFKRLAKAGWAAEYRVWGQTAMITIDSTMRTVRPGEIKLSW